MATPVLNVSALVSRSIHVAARERKSTHGRTWRPDELAFLKNNLGRMSEYEIAQALPGRSKTAVHLMRERSGLPAMIKVPGMKSANSWREILGMADQRPIIAWVKNGLIKGRVTEAQGGRKICMIEDDSMRAFVLSPNNWVYFNPNGVKDAELKRMIEKQRKRWGDEWLTNRQAADLLTIRWKRPVCSKDILHMIKMGRLDGRHILNKDGRQHVNETPRWSLWMVRRSQVETMRYMRPGDALSGWTDAADSFLVLARAIGLSDLRIGKLMGKSHAVIGQRWKRLQELGRIRKIAREIGGGVKVSGRTVSANWRRYRRRFAFIEKAARRCSEGSANRDDRRLMDLVSKHAGQFRGR